MGRYDYKDKPKYIFDSKIDYLTGSFACQHKTWQETLFLDKETAKVVEELTIVTYGSFLMGQYTKKHEFNGIIVYSGKVKSYDENDEPIVYDKDIFYFLWLGGKAISEIIRFNCFEENQYSQFVGLIKNLVNHNNFNVSRIDGALDDYDGVLDLEIMRKKGEKRHFKGVLRTFDTNTNVIPFNAVGEVLSGITLYFGSRQSDVLMRFYDKRAETVQKRLSILDKQVEIYCKQQKNIELSHTIDKHDKNVLLQELEKDYQEYFQEIEDCLKIEKWQRYEIQLRRDTAKLFLDTLIRDYDIYNGLCDVGGITHSWIVSRLTMLEKPKNDSNKSRWEEWRQWSDFKKGVTIDYVTPVRKRATIEDKRVWLETQVMPTYTLVNFLYKQAYDREIRLNYDLSLTNLMNAVEFIENLDKTREEKDKIYNELVDKFIYTGKK